MCVGKRPVETVKDGDEDGKRTDRNEIGKIGGNAHDTLLSMDCVSTRPATRITHRGGQSAWSRAEGPPWLERARFLLASYQKCGLMAPWDVPFQSPLMAHRGLLSPLPAPWRKS